MLDPVKHLWLKSMTNIRLKDVNYCRKKVPSYDSQKKPPEVFLGKGQRYSLLKLHFGIYMFSCKFAAYFQNTFSYERLRRAASELKSTTKKWENCETGYLDFNIMIVNYEQIF